VVFKKVIEYIPGIPDEALSRIVFENLAFLSSLFAGYQILASGLDGLLKRKRIAVKHKFASIFFLPPSVRLNRSFWLVVPLAFGFMLFSTFLVNFLKRLQGGGNETEDEMVLEYVVQGAPTCMLGTVSTPDTFVLAQD